jgi:hypothetical protein
METSGLSEAELLKTQEEMFANVREKYHTGPEESGNDGQKGQDKAMSMISPSMKERSRY